MKRNTAKQILDTATPLFASSGFRNVTVDKLAKAANVNGAAIIYHFGSKENLYREVLESQFSPAIHSLREVNVSCRQTAIERILTYVRIITAIQHKQPYLTALWQYEMCRHAAGHNRFITEYTFQSYQHIVSALCHGIAQKEFHSSLNPHHAACVLLEIMHAPHVIDLLLPEQPLSGTNARKSYTFKTVCYYLQGIRHAPVMRNISRLHNRAKKRGGL